MRDTVVAKFNAGEFSDNFEHYMGTPPDSIKEMVIAPAALALTLVVYGVLSFPEALHIQRALNPETWTIPKLQHLTPHNMQ